MSIAEKQSFVEQQSRQQKSKRLDDLSPRQQMSEYVYLATG